MDNLNFIIYSSVAGLGGLTGFAILFTSQKKLTARAVIGSFLMPSLVSFAAVAWHFGEFSADTENRVAPLAVAVIIGALYGTLTVPQIAAALMSELTGRLGVLAKLAAEVVLQTKDDDKGSGP